MTDDLKLIYVMNHYSEADASHFSHIIGLLSELASQGVAIRLLVEKGGLPVSPHPLVQVVGIQHGVPRLRRMALLYREIGKARRAGFTTAFVRISAWSALVTVMALRGKRGRVFFWQSGTTIEFDKQQPFGLAKLKWLASTWAPGRLVWRYCDFFVTGPEPMLDYYADVGKVDRRRLRLLYNDVDLDRFHWSAEDRKRARAQLRQELDLPGDARIMLFVHRLSPVRRTLDYLPSALADAKSAGQLDGWHLLIAGGGGDLLRLLQEALALGLEQQIRSLGEVANFGIERLYAGADLFIQPSHAEGFPRVLIEAMAAGLPIVTTDAGGTAAILGAQQQAFITPRDDPVQFSAALSRLMGDSERMNLLANENLEAVQRFATPRIAKMYREVLFDEA